MEGREAAARQEAIGIPNVRTHERTNAIQFLDYQTGRHCLLFKEWNNICSS